jgi:hypothetical protein
MAETLSHSRMAEISSGYTEVLSPTGIDQLRTVGQIMGLCSQSKVVDFGCGYAEALRVWGREFGITAVGIENHGFLSNRWLDDNPKSPERAAVIESFHRGQNMYFKYRRSGDCG